MSEIPKTWMGEESRWGPFLEYCLKQPAVGFDTEFTPDRQITVWSLAVASKSVSPIGYQRAYGYVLPAAALQVFAPLLTSEAVTKWAHNAVADTRSVWASTGIVMRNVQDTLGWSRVACPGLPSHGLKPLSKMLLAKPSRPGFKQVMTYQVEVTTTKHTKKKVCSCGVPGCRKRLNHVRTEVLVERVVKKTEERMYDQREVIPGHERFPAWAAYALEDAVDAFELASFLAGSKNKLKCSPTTSPGAVRQFLQEQEC